MSERIEKRQNQTRANEIFAAAILQWVRSEAAARLFLEQRGVDEHLIERVLKPGALLR